MEGTAGAGIGPTAHREATMAKLTLTAFVTLDGVMQAPGGPREDRSGAFLHGGWVMALFDPEVGQFIDGRFREVGGFLLGRRTYEIFASYWPRMTDAADPVASALNGLPKYVASRSLARADWAGSRVIRDLPADVEALKKADGKPILVQGSIDLLQTLLAYELLDEITLLQFPLVLGTGKRLFGSGTVPTGFTLAGPARTTEKGVVITTLRPAGRPAYGSAEVEDPRT
jgi:dihydrofolate reductase